MTQKVRAGKQSQGFRTELQGRRAWVMEGGGGTQGVGEVCGVEGGGGAARCDAESRAPPMDPSRLTPRTPFGTYFGAAEPDGLRRPLLRPNQGRCAI